MSSVYHFWFGLVTGIFVCTLFVFPGFALNDDPNAFVVGGVALFSGLMLHLHDRPNENNY